MAYKKILFLSAVSIALTSCSGSGIKDTLGMRKPVPDEFVVISNPPLSQPPQFDLLEPGKMTVPETVIKSKDGGLTQEEQKLLQMLGSDAISSNVKNEIDAEHKAKIKNDTEKNVVSKALSGIRGDSKEEVIDPLAERQRIQNNKKDNKPINAGEVQIQKQSTIDRILK